MYNGGITVGPDSAPAPGGLSNLAANHRGGSDVMEESGIGSDSDSELHFRDRTVGSASLRTDNTVFAMKVSRL